ncbi:MAG: galactose-1-phosphate uridylyltransferase [Candidatus Altiarchaeales archaeon]|nr:galactose-1-phosphate uridylyltransferase [Candidatus Altiarchaeales archaeon]
MNELRKDYLLDRWVIIASERAKRPTDFVVKKEEYPVGACYFCPGNENTTPPEIGRIEKDGRWTVRWFPNKYPATTEKNKSASKGLLASASAYGRHEIIVETPLHNQDFEELPLGDMQEVLEVCANRIKQLNQNKGIKYVLVFKNRGREAGASLAHSHFQVIALSKIPSLVEKEVQASRKYWKKTKRCILCDTLKKELKSERKVYKDKNTGVFAPYASRFPFEAWVMPKRHVKNLDELKPEEKKSFTLAVKKTLLSLDKMLNKPPYNFYFHVSPKKGDLHMHLEICPKLSIQAGFEFGSDMYINVVPPEDAARHYKTGI